MIKVRTSSELQRIKSLPQHNNEIPDDIRAQITACITRADGPGKMQLRPAQELALAHIQMGRGGLIRLKVGAGKTLVACLAPSLFPNSRAVILTEAKLRDQGDRMMHEYARHFRINRQTQWISYETVSNPRYADLLESIAPTIIIADEAQTFKNRTSARTSRFINYMRAHPETILVVMTGTFFHKSIKDISHLADMALHERSPLPRNWNVLTEWADCIDYESHCYGQVHPGALVELSPTPVEEISIDEARHLVNERIRTSYGVCWSSDSAVEADLRLSWFKPTPCPLIAAALDQLRTTWTRPDGVELVSPLEIVNLEDQLKLGGYYRWVYPPEPEWLEARREWVRLVGQKVKSISDVDEDSEALFREAIYEGKYPEHAPVLRRWETAKETYPEPPKEWVWISRSLIDDVVAYVKKHPPTVIWSDVVSFSEELARTTGLKYYGQGVGDEINHDSGKASIVASFSACKTGKNLQIFNRNLIICGPRLSESWEQMIGRTHRSGQMAECVRVDICESFKDAFEKATANAEFIRSIEGDVPKILYATREGGGWPV